MVEDWQHRAGDQPGLARALGGRGQEECRIGAVAAVRLEVVLDRPDMAEAELVEQVDECERLGEIGLGRLLV